MKKYLFLIISFFSFLTSQSQDMRPSLLFDKSFVQYNEKKGKEKFKGQILKDKRNGMGFIFYKNGDLFAGDFYRDNITGIGLYISESHIKNCGDCKIYVGEWKDGKKSGNGTCYSDNGDAIYQGQFLDDKPTGQFNANIKSLKKISLIKLNEEDIFLGESKDELPNGFGIIIFGNGDLWQGTFVNGQRKGIGLYSAADGEWQTLNVIGDSSAIVSSSVDYRYLDEERKSNYSRGLTSALSYFGQAAKSGVQLAIDIRNSQNKDTDADAGSSGNTSSKRTSTSSKKCKQCAGNGKCSGGTGSSSRYHCHGSKKCGWCNGDGFNLTAGNMVKCTRCKGKGICTYCEGTGLCSSCKGTGKG